jgi:hypothetical protein
LLQSTGLMIGIAMILIGLAMYHPRKPKPVKPAS